MNANRKAPWVLLLKGILFGLMYVLGSITGGAIMGVFHIKFPDLTPPGVSQAVMLRYFALSSPLVGLGLLPLALGMGATRRARWFALALLLFVCIGVNTVIEMTIFSTTLAHGGALALAASFLLPALFCAFALATLASSETAEPSLVERTRSFFAAHSAGGWAWRLLLALLAFPLVYFLFGSMVGPFVIDTYKAGIANLVLPPVGAILKTQFVRSALFLLASLPILVLWKGSRKSLILALGLALWVMVGLFGLVQAVWLPAHLRILHSLEIGADSFAHAGALTVLLFPRRSERRANHVVQVAHELPL
jgi:hypothetical protein